MLNNWEKSGIKTDILDKFQKMLIIAFEENSAKMSLKMHFFRILTYSETSHGLTCACASALRDAKSPKMASQTQKYVVLSALLHGGTKTDRPYSLPNCLGRGSHPFSKRSCSILK